MSDKGRPHPEDRYGTISEGASIETEGKVCFKHISIKVLGEINR